MFGRGDAARDRIRADRLEIVPGALLVLAHRGLVPFRAEFPATAQVGEDVGTAVLQPQLAGRAEIARQLRDLVSAVTVHQRRRGPVHLHAGGLHEEVGNFRPVLARRLQLFDLHAVGHEIRRRRLEHRRRSAAVGIIERRRLEEARDRVHDLVGLVRTRGDADGGVARQFDLLLHPLAVFEIDLQHLAHDIVEQADEERIGGVSAAALGLAVGRRPDERLGRSVGIGLPLFEVHRDQAVCGEGLVAHRPVDIGRIQHVPVDDAVRRRLERNVEPQPLAVLLDVIFGLMETYAAVSHPGLHDVVVVAHEVCPGGDVARLAAKDFGGVGDIGAALPDARAQRIFAFGKRSFAEIAADEQRVFIHPARAALALFRQGEPAVDEAAGRIIELAQDGGVLASVGQRDHALVHCRGQAGHTLEHPFLALGRCERVDVEDRLPFGIGGTIGFERRGAQDALGVVLVLPEVRQAIGAEADVGNAALVVEDRQRIGLELGKARIGFERGEGALVLRFDPGERLGAARFFEPDEGILFGTGNAICGGFGLVIVGGSAGGRGDGHGSRQCNCGNKFQTSSPRGMRAYGCEA